jgi:hypothetical protein
MRKTVGILAAVLFGATVAVMGAVPASAATPTLRFHGAQYDTPGADTPVSNARLNGEWISLINSGTKAVNLKGYTIRDKANHVYTFGSFTIPAKSGRVWVNTGKGGNTSTKVYQNRGYYIWNNDGDTAYLRNASGKAVDSCTWGYKKNRTWVGC